MKNFWKMDDFFPDSLSYAYLDHESYFADKIFMEKGIRVKFIREMHRENAPYRIIFCKVQKRERERLESALKELENKILLAGYKDYPLYCTELEEELAKERGLRQEGEFMEEHRAEEQNKDQNAQHNKDQNVQHNKNQNVQQNEYQNEYQNNHQNKHIENALSEDVDLATLMEDSYLLCKEFIEKAKLKKGQLFIVGCSTSEVLGEKIGTASSYSVAKALFQGIDRAAKEKKVFLCTQCCEHLNRAIIIEGAVAEKLGFLDAIVNVVPKEKAGGSFSTVAYESFHEPVALERVRTDGGMDIGDTFIGMHLKAVAVPLRLSKNALGSAHLTAARVRPKFVGGSRAVYDESLL